MSQAEFGHAQRFRATHFLNADTALVETSFADRARFPDRETWGVPLTLPEVAELNRRADVQLSIGPALRWAATAADEAYAGTWIDHSRAGIPVVMVVGTADALAAGRSGVGRTGEFMTGMKSRVPVGTEIAFATADLNWDQLLDLKAQIWTAREELRGSGIPIVSVAIDTSTNTAIVGLAPLRKADTATLVARFGQHLTFRYDPDNAVPDADYCDHDCMPAKGGIQIYNANSPAAKCTTGFMVHVLGDPDRGEYRALLTAGHCFVLAAGDHGVGDKWKHVLNAATDPVVGDVRGDTWYSGLKADVGLLDLATVPSDRNNIVSSNSGTITNITSWGLNSEQIKNGDVCRMGYNTGRDCGIITFPSVDRESSSHVASKSMLDQWETDMDADLGDSGGPYFLGSRGYGIHVDSPDGYTTGSGARGWYSTLQNAETTYRARYGYSWFVCVTTSC